MYKKTIACVIARTVSTRLPLKVLRNVVNEYSMLDFMLQRLKLVENINDIYICTSRETMDDILEDVAVRNKVKIYRGSPDAVIERLLAVGELEKANNVIRITGDNVFTSYEYLEEQINIHNENQLDYTRIIDVPIGATAEVMKLEAVKECYESIDPAISEYLLLYMFKPEHYKCGVIALKNIKNSSDYTLTVDTKEDLERTRKIFEHYQDNPLEIKLKDIVNIIDRNTIQNSKMQFSGNVKMPYGREISFEEFQSDMNERIANSQKFIIGGN
jgi:spore coat polysaccharide biosynthesis protein SpsF